MLTGRVPAKKDTSSKRVPEVTAADRLEVFSQTMRTQLSELENRSAVALRDETFLELSQRVHDISSRCDRILRQRRYLADEVAATTAAAAEEAEAEAALDSGSVRHRNTGGAEGRRMEDTARAEVAVTAGTSKQPRRKRRRRRVGSGGRLDLGGTVGSGSTGGFVASGGGGGRVAGAGGPTNDRAEAMLEDLVDMASVLKGEVTTINSTVVLQNRELGKLGEVADDNRSTVSHEAKALTKYYKSSTSFFGTFFRSVAVLVAFVLTVLYMSFFSRRF